MKFSRIKYFHITDFGYPDISFGIHICLKGRIDIHILKYMISIGNVPMYADKKGEFAVSNSYHSTKIGSLRSGIP